MTELDLNSTPKPRIARRDFLKLLKVFGLSFLFAAAGGAYFTKSEADWWEVKQVGLILPGLPAAFSGMRLIQVSDIHMGGWMNIERLRQVFEIVKKLEPNMLAITGDFVLSSSWEQTQEAEMLELETELKLMTAQYPTLAVLGNHDHWADAPAVTQMLSRGGVRVLANTVQRIQIGKDYLYFAGVDDVLLGMNRLDQVLAKLPEKERAILLVHEPDFANVSAATGRFNLQLSGHSHGGQVNIPGIGAPVLPQLARIYPQGLYKVGKMYHYTNRGVGMTRPFIRINCRPEITVFTLKSQ